MFSYNYGSNDCSKYADQAEWLRISDILNDWCKADRTCREVKELAILGACENGEIEYTRNDGKTFDDPVVELYGRGLLLINKNSFNEWKQRIEQLKTKTSSAQTNISMSFSDFLNKKDDEYISIRDAIDLIHKHMGLNKSVDEAAQFLMLAIGDADTKPNIYKKHSVNGWQLGRMTRPYAFESRKYVPESEKVMTIQNAIEEDMSKRLSDDLPF